MSFSPVNLAAWQYPPQHALDQHVDGISGATLSVRALKKIARISLYLEQQL